MKSTNQSDDDVNSIDITNDLKSQGDALFKNMSSIIDELGSRVNKIEASLSELESMLSMAPKEPKNA